jgi:hypothetical protein
LVRLHDRVRAGAGARRLVAARADLGARSGGKSAATVRAAGAALTERVITGRKSGSPAGSNFLTLVLSSTRPPLSPDSNQAGWWGYPVVAGRPQDGASTSRQGRSSLPDAFCAAGRVPGTTRHDDVVILVYNLVYNLEIDVNNDDLDLGISADNLGNDLDRDVRAPRTALW